MEAFVEDYVHVIRHDLKINFIRKLSKTTVKNKNHINHEGNLVNNAVPSHVQFLISVLFVCCNKLTN